MKHDAFEIGTLRRGDVILRGDGTSTYLITESRPDERSEGHQYLAWIEIRDEEITRHEGVWIGALRFVNERSNCVFVRRGAP